MGYVVEVGWYFLWFGCQTCDHQVASSSAGLVLGWVTVCGPVNHLCM